MSAQPIDRSESIFVDNKQKDYPIDAAAIERAVSFVLDEEGAASGDVTVTFVDSAEMSGLNKKYRGIDGPTDVLSFSMTEQGIDEPNLVAPEPEPILGDVVVCPRVAAENAVDQRHSTEREILEITIHGILHLLGYEHETLDDASKMLARQVELAEMINET